jgi:hypothetical protein
MHADPSVDTLGFCFWTHFQGAFPPPRWGPLTRTVGLTRRRSRRCSPCGTSTKTRVPGFLASGRGRCEMTIGSAWSPFRLASRFFYSCWVQRCAPGGLGSLCTRWTSYRWSGAGRGTGITQPTLRLRRVGEHLSAGTWSIWAAMGFMAMGSTSQHIGRSDRMEDGASDAAAK